MGFEFLIGLQPNSVCRLVLINKTLLYRFAKKKAQNVLLCDNSYTEIFVHVLGRREGGMDASCEKLRILLSFKTKAVPKSSFGEGSPKKVHGMVSEILEYMQIFTMIGKLISLRAPRKRFSGQRERIFCLVFVGYYFLIVSKDAKTIFIRR